jgi:hypothetical protein
MNKNVISVCFSLFFLMTCSDEANDPNSNSSSVGHLPHYGTYLYNDDDCGGSDIQYATIDTNGVSFYDFLGDGCDDTVGCYSTYTYELTEFSSDTFLIVTGEGSSISNAELYIDGDSSFTLMYKTSNGSVATNSWEKIKDEIYSFDPACDQDYGNTKNIADMMVYAVGDNRELLWKIYLNGGLWDLGSSVTPMQDGGFMVLGKFDAITSSGCCYTRDYGARDLIKIDSQGQVEWQKEIQISDDGLSEEYYVNIGTSLFETSQGDMVFLTPGSPGNNKLMIVMIDMNGDLIWKRNYSDDNLSYNSGSVEILESDDGDLILAGGWSPATLTVIDYGSGSVLSSSDLPGVNVRSITKTEGGYVVIGFGDSDNVTSIKVDHEGSVIWSQIYEDPSTNSPLDIIELDDGGYLIFCYSTPPPYATLIKIDSSGDEVWRKKYDDYIGGGKGWIYKTEDGGYFMGSGYAVTKLDPGFNVQWSAACSSCFDKNFNNGMVSGINHNMKKMDGGAVFVGYGAKDWE